MEHKDKKRIQDDIQRGADYHREHAGGGKALGGNEHVHAQRDLHKNRAAGVNPHIAVGVADRIPAGAKRPENGLSKHQEHGCQHNGKPQQSRKAVAQDFFRFFKVLLPHGDSRLGRAPHGNQRAERHNENDDGKGNSHPGQGQRPGFRNMPDVNPVHNIVEHVHHLGRDGGHSQRKHQPADTVRAQVPPLFLLFCPIHIQSSSSSSTTGGSFTMSRRESRWSSISKTVMESPSARTWGCSPCFGI